MNSKAVSIGIVIIIVAGAAYYFGTTRSSESGAQQSSTTTGTQQSGIGEYKEVDAKVVGTWKSQEDPKFTRTFSADGTVTDRYEGDASATETAAFVTIDPIVVEVPGVPAASLSDVTVIRIDFASGPMFFSINTLTDTELAMTNLSGRGNILTFTKVQ